MRDKFDAIITITYAIIFYNKNITTMGIKKLTVHTSKFVFNVRSVGLYTTRIPITQLYSS